MLGESEYFPQETILKCRYQILKLLGEGSFGQTYLAKDTYNTDSQPTVVIKRLKPQINNQVLEVARKKFISEAFSLRKLGYKHSQIPTLLDFFYRDDDFFLVQEYIEGIDLATKLNLKSDLQNRVIFSEAEGINLLTQLLSILQCIHDNQTIHLDIKPLNIIWREKDNKYFLIDFGCVKDISSYILVNDQINTSAILGTPHYMPKEQALGNPQYNSDIYALGIVVIQAVTGLDCLDFRYDNDGQLIWQDKAHITDDFKVILNKMIQVDHHENYRYQTVVEILADVKKIKPSFSIKTLKKILDKYQYKFWYKLIKLGFFILVFSPLLWLVWEIWFKPRIWETSHKISMGEEVYFANQQDCTRKFKRKNYLAAQQCYKKFMSLYSNNPELAIYYNNSFALNQKKNPFYLASVVPISNNSKIAKEILRGIAHSQQIFNQNGGIDGRLLVIVIADDGNLPNNAQNIAKLIRGENLISGVIGHNSSTATAAGIREYQKNNMPLLSPEIPIISSTSTSNSLQQEDAKQQFFRTAISDEMAINFLAQYITDVAQAQTIAIFYEPNKNHPESAKSSLINNLRAIKVITPEDLQLTNSKFFHLNSINNTQEAKQKIKLLLANGVKHLALFPDVSNLEGIKFISLAITEIPEAKKLKIYGVTPMYSYDVIYDPLAGNILGLEGLILSLDWAREIPQAKEFLEQFKAQWGSRNSLISWRTATSYDATQVFIKAFQENQHSRQDILNFLRKDFQLKANYTSGQDVTFDLEGNRIGKPVLVELVLGSNKSLKFQFKCDQIDQCNQ